MRARVTPVRAGTAGDAASGAASAAPAAPRRARRLARDRDAERGRDGAVDAREAAVRVHGDAPAGHGAVGVADEPRGAEHEPVVRPGRRPDRVDEHAARHGRTHGGELRAHVLALRREVRHVPGLVDAAANGCRLGQPLVDDHAARAHPAARPRALVGRRRRARRRAPRARSGAPDDRGCTTRCRVGATTIVSTPSRCTSAGTSRDSVGCPNTITRSTGVAEPGLAQQLAVGDHEVRSEVRAARDLGDERPAAVARELLGARARRRRPRRRSCAARLDRPRRSSAGRGRTLVGGRASRVRRRPMRGRVQRRAPRTAARGTAGSGAPAPARDAAPSRRGRRGRAPRRRPRGRGGPRHPLRPAAPSGAATSRSSRTAPAKMPGCMVVWFERMPRSSAGRSAEQTMSGTPEWCASSTAGCRFATAVPDVVTTTAGRPDSIAVPSARNAAPRSSMRTCRRIAPTRSSSAAASASACEREPGATTTSRTPSRTNALRSAIAVSLAGLRRVLARRGAGSAIRSRRTGPPHPVRRAHRGACARCRARRCRSRRRMPRVPGPAEPVVPPAAPEAPELRPLPAPGVVGLRGSSASSSASSCSMRRMRSSCSASLRRRRRNSASSSGATVPPRDGSDTGGPTAPDDEPQQAADDGHEEDDDDPPAAAQATDARSDRRTRSRRRRRS